MTAEVVATIVVLMLCVFVITMAAREVRKERVEFSSPSTEPVIDALRPLEAWTPLQREALGIDATDAWILATQSELNRLEWAETTARQVAEPAEPEVTHLYAWSQVEPVRTMVDGRTITTGTPNQGQIAAARQKRFEESPTVTGERVFG